MSWLHTHRSFWMDFFFFSVVVVPTSPSGWFHDGSVGGIGVCYLSLQMILHRLGALGSFTSSPFLFFSYRLLAIFLPPPVFQVVLEGRKKKMEGGFFIILSSVSFKSSVTRQLLLFFLSFDHQHEEWWMLIMSTFHLSFFFSTHTHTHIPGSRRSPRKEKTWVKYHLCVFSSFFFFSPCHMQLSIMFCFFSVCQTVNTCLWIRRTSWESTRPRAGNRRTLA